jgi:hypothetical protein
MHTEHKKYPCDESPINTNITSTILHNYENVLNLNKINDESKNKLVCKTCNKNFARSDSLARHLNNASCKIEKNNNDYKEKYDELVLKFDKLLNLINTNGLTNNFPLHLNNMTNSTNSNNSMKNSYNTNSLNNNITIYQFGKEDYSKISNVDILKTIMSSTGVGIPVALIEKIHFNNDYPEYKNVCITDINRKHALLWNGKKWLRKKYDNIGTDMLDKCLYLISDRMDELEKIVSDHYTFNIKKKTLDKLENINSDEELDESEDDEKVIKNKVEDRKNFRKFASEKIEESLYNNKDIICNIVK